MRSFRLEALTARGRVLRALLIVTLLLGSLFPQIPGMPAVVVATAVAVPVITYDIWRLLPRIHPVLYFVVPLFGILAIHAAFIPPSTGYGIDKLLRFLTLTLAGAMSACLLRDREDIMVFARTWVAVSAVLATFALLEFTGTGRAVGFDSNPIWLARAFATAALIILWHWWTQEDRRPILLVTLAILLLGLLATGSRGPVMGFVVGCVPLVLLEARNRRVRISVFCGALVMMFVSLQVLPMFSGNRLTDSGGTAGESNYYRQLLLDITPPVILEHPLGVGFGNWATATGAPKQYTYPHNILLEMTTELGIPVALFFISMVTYVIVLLLRGAKTDPVSLLILSLLCAELVAVNVSGDLNARTFFFLLTLGYLVGRRGEPIVSRKKRLQPADLNVSNYPAAGGW